MVIKEKTKINIKTEIMKVKGIYEVTEASEYALAIHYDYYWEEATHDAPAEDELEVTKVTLNGVDVTTFYYDFLENKLDKGLNEYAQENKHN